MTERCTVFYMCLQHFIQRPWSPVWHSPAESIRTKSILHCTSSCGWLGDNQYFDPASLWTKPSSQGGEEAINFPSEAEVCSRCFTLHFWHRCFLYCTVTSLQFWMNIGIVTSQRRLHHLVDWILWLLLWVDDPKKLCVEILTGKRQIMICGNQNGYSIHEKTLNSMPKRVV